MHAKIIVIMSVKELVYLMQNPVDLHKISVHFSHLKAMIGRLQTTNFVMLEDAGPGLTLFVQR